MSYGAVRRWLLEHTPIEPSLLEGAGFETLVAGRLAASGGISEAEYVAVLDRSGDEVEQLTAGIAVSETWLFRYPESFRFLGDDLARRRNASGASLRMASIGCASGEEPCAMAMVALHAGWPAEQIAIDAFDINGEALRRARSGVLGVSSIRTEIPAWAVEFLVRSGGSVVIDPAARAPVRFVQADATRPGALGAGPPRDVIFCRNLLIYLAADARRRLLDAICASLAPGGLLFVGHAEPLLCAGPALRPVLSPHVFALDRMVEEAGGASSVRPPTRSVSLIAPARSIAPGAHSSIRPAAQPRVASPEPSIADARDLADSGRTQESEAMVRAILSRSGPSAEALELLGMIRMACDDAAGAKTCFEQSLYLEPSRTASILQLAMITERRGDSRRAGALWDRARRTPGAGDQGTRA